MTVFSPVISVTGSGSGNANQRDIGQVTATINGSVFFQQQGVFTRLIDFLGSGAAHVTLQPGANTLVVSGSVSGCSASDTVVVFYDPNPVKTKKNLGPQNICNGTNPINGGTGNKYQQETDYKGNGVFPLVFRRHYNSSDTYKGTLGKKWRHSYSSYLAFSSNSLIAERPSGQGYQFQLQNNQWLPDADVNFRIEAQADGSWILVRDDDAIERYDSQGRLMSIQLRDTLTQTLTYDNAGRLAQVTDPTGQSLIFQYVSATADTQLARLVLPDQTEIHFGYANNNLTEVIYPDQTPLDDTDNPKKQYHYENLSFPSALTGITDENGSRFATWDYDGQGRAVLSEHALGSDKTTLIYNTDGSTQITDALNASRLYYFNSVLDVDKNTGNSQPAGSGCQASSRQLMHDQNGNITRQIDFDGHRTDTHYDLTRNLQISQTTGLTETGTTTPVTTTRTTQWHDNFRLPVSIAETGRMTTLSYDPYGHITERKITDIQSGGTRTLSTTYSYAPDAPGFIVQSVEDGPHVDVNDQTQFDYYPPNAICLGGHPGCRGQLKQITNALAQITQFNRYNTHGQLEQMIDPNGEITEIRYDKRQRIARIDKGGQLTQFFYDPVGQLIQIIHPDQTTLTYSYDAAHRLTGITDALGNRIQYTRDSKGNPLKEEMIDPNGQLTHHLEAEYDALGRLMLSIKGELQTRQYLYDANGNLTAQSDPRNTPTDRQQARTLNPLLLDNTVSHRYDTLDQLIESVHPQQQSNAQDDVVSTTVYDDLGRISQIIDPNGSITHYHYNAFDDLLLRDSPDTVTRLYNYDKAGNLISQTDARGITVNYHYDALNRVTRIDYPDTILNIQLSYDENDSGQNGIGRLTTVIDASGTTRFRYDQQGNLSSQITQLEGHDYQTNYRYNAANQIVQITYPSGLIIDQHYNAIGRLGKVTVQAANGAVQTLVDHIQYQPFGPVSTMTYGNGLVDYRTYDQDYRLTDHTLDILSEHSQQYDLADNITAQTDLNNPTNNKTFDYDGLNRLTFFQNDLHQQEYTLDANSNRLTQTTDGLQDDYSYELSNNHLLSRTGIQYRYDANGNMIWNGHYDYRYGDHNRLLDVSDKGISIARYTYNAFGQRVKKETPTSVSYYHYHQNGQLLAESDANGTVLVQYSYVNGQPLSLHQTQGYQLQSRIGDQLTLFENSKTLRFQDSNGLIIEGPAHLDFNFNGVEGYSLSGSKTIDSHHQIGYRFWGLFHNHRSGFDWINQYQHMTTQVTHRYQNQFQLKPISEGQYQGQNITDGTHVNITMATRSVTFSRYQNDGTLAVNTVILPDTAWQVNTSGNQQTSTFNYQANVGSPRLIGSLTEQTSSTGTTLVAGSIEIQQSYSVYHHIVASEMTAKRLDNTYYFYNDHLGTPQRLTDSSGTTVWQADYDAFGKTQIQTETITQNLRFPGQYFDQETGLYYNYYRYYDPQTGRYITSDPIGLVGGLNTYAYVENNPINYIDPYGLLSFNFNQFANQVKNNRANNALTIGSLITTGAIGTMPKSQRELRGFGLAKSELNPITNQLSRLTTRTGNRAFRTLGRTTGGIVLSGIATLSLVGEGFFDIGVITKSAFDATSFDDNSCN